MKFRILIDTERCKGCALCEAFCERKVLKVCGTLNSHGLPFAEARAPLDCVGCGRCALVCPDAAIEILAERDDGEAPAGIAGRGASGRRRAAQVVQDGVP
jgi:2-oxoglutarate ferredoxin oxidoreductase subunit delta